MPVQRPAEEGLVQLPCPNPLCGFRVLILASQQGQMMRCPRCRFAIQTMANPSTTPSSETGAVPPPSLKKEPGGKIGRFVIRRFLDEGGFGTVYHAYDPHLEREVALKVPRAGTLNRPERRKRFLGDAQAAARLRHPNIVPVYDAGAEGDDCYIASAYIEGQTLRHALRSGLLSVRRSVEIVRALAEALAYAHEQTIVHRDIKPENVMLDGKGEPHLIDFGLARRHEAPSEAEQDDLDPAGTGGSAGHTRAGAVMGTPAYMSPEHTSDAGQAGPASDQYSLGATLYELLCGQTPFAGIPWPNVIHPIRHQPPPPPRQHRPDLPEDLQAICLKTLAKKPEERYPSCRELAEDLRRFLHGEPVSVRPLPLRERGLRWCRREPALTSAVALVSAAILAGAVLGVIFGFAEERAAREQSELRAVADQERDNARELAHKEESARREADVQREHAVEQSRIARDLSSKEVQARQLAEQKGREAEQKGREAEKARAEVQERLHEANRDRYFHRIRLAERELRDGNPARATQLLESCPEGVPRMWEWHHLAFEARRERGGGQGIHGLCFSPKRGNSKSWVAWAGPGAKVILRRPTARDKGDDVLQTYEAPAPVHCLAFSGTGRHLALGLVDGTVLVWDLGTAELPMKPREVFTYKHGFKDQHAERVNCIAFGPGGQLASAGGRSVHITPSELTVEKLRRFDQAHPTDITWLAFDPTGENLITVSADNRLRYWACKDGKPQIQPFEDFTAGAFHPRGRYLGVAKVSGTIEIRDPNLVPICLFHGHTRDVRGLTFRLDDKAVSVDEDGIVKVWEVKNKAVQELTTVRSLGGYALEPGPNPYLAWRPDRQTICLRALENGRTSTWKWETGKNVQPGEDREQPQDLDTYAEYVHSVAWSRDGRWLCTGSSVGRAAARQLEAGECKVWDAATGKLAHSAEMANPVWTVACGEGGRLAWAGRGRSISRWANLGQGAPSKDEDAHRGDINRVTFGPDGSLASAGADGTVKVRNPAGVVHHLFSLKGPVLALALSPDGDLLAAGDEMGNVVLWNLLRGKMERELFLPHQERVNDLVFSPNGSWLAAASDQGRIQLWNVQTGKPVHTLEGHGNGTLALTFSPDSQRLTSAGRDKTVRLWEPATGREVLALPVRRGLRFGIAFSPDGSQLAVATTEGVIRWQGGKAVE